MIYRVISRLQIFYKRYLFHYIAVASLVLFILCFVSIVASIGYEDAFDYDSQWFLRKLRHLLVLPAGLVILYLVVLFSATAKERKVLLIHERANFGRYYILVALGSLFVIIVTFHLFRTWFYKVATNAQIETYLFYALIIVLGAFISFAISIILFFIPVATSNDHRKPVLLLRSFGDTSYNNFVSGKDDAVYKSLISTIAQQMRSVFPTILYNDVKSEFSRADQFGSFTFSNASNWLQKVTHLSHHSVAVIMVPIPTEGVITEINMLLRKGLMHKVYFLMPPENVLYLSKKEVELTWEQHRIEFSKAAIILPKYVSSGLLFTLHKDFTLDHVLNLKYSINSVRELRKHLEKEVLYSPISLGAILKS